MRMPAKIRSLHLQTKILICIVVAAMLPLFTIAVLFYGRFYDMVISDTVQDEQQLTASLIPKIESEINAINNAMTQIEESRLYAELFNSAGVSNINSIFTSDAGAAFDQLVEQIKEETEITDVRIYTTLPKDNPVYQSNYGSKYLAPESDIKSTYWHGIFSATNLGELYCPKFYLGAHEIEEYNDSAYVIRRTMFVNNDFHTCYIALYYPSEIYEEVLSKSITVDNSVSYILNKREAVIATTNSALSGMYHLDYYDIQAMLMASNSFIKQDVSGGSVYAAFYYLEETEWFVVTVLPEKSLLAIANDTIIKFILICLLSLLLGIVIAMSIARSITRRIYKLSKQMELADAGRPEPLPDPHTKDEVGKLIASYNNMTQEITTLMKEQKETAEALRLAEYNSLQAQINPHFLYNTMDMIHWMSLQGRNDEVSEVVQSLSRFYKLTLSRRKDYSTIENELEHAQVYIQLMNKRYGDKIDFVIDVPDDLTQYRIPKLTFQPILENAILHGILEKQDKSGTIVLTAWEEDDDIIILISDDGVGMDENTIKQILSDEIVHERKGSNIAIYNIHNRMRLLYGDGYGLEYSGEPGKGCEVIIRIPKQIQNKNEK